MPLGVIFVLLISYEAMKILYPLLCALMLGLIYPVRAQTFQINDGTVDFKSEAPLEIIKASSTELKGLIDFTQGTFAFSIPIISFKGFNSALQREHFNENYMETERFPRATFAGKMIEQVDIARDGEYAVRAKGKLTIHGVVQERIIPSTITVKDGKISVRSSFSVLLVDHNIDIPKVVQHKIAETIFVEIKANGEKR